MKVFTFFISLLLLQFGLSKTIDDYLAEPSTDFSYKMINNTRITKGETVDLNKQEFLVNNFEWLNIFYSTKLNCYVPNVDENSTISEEVLLVLKENSAFPTTDKIREERIISEVNGIKGIICEVFVLPENISKIEIEGIAERKKKGKGGEGLELLAATISKFLKTNETKYLMHFPMVKAISQSMNVIDSIYKNNITLSYSISGDGIINGINTYLLSIVDSRVNFIVPRNVEFDLASLFNNTWKQHCYFIEAFEDFKEYLVILELYNPLFPEMLKHIDPYYYFIDLEYLTAKNYHSKIFVLLNPKDEFWTTFNSQRNYFQLQTALAGRGTKNLFMNYGFYDNDNVDIEDDTLLIFKKYKTNKFIDVPDVSWSDPYNNTVVLNDNEAKIDISFGSNPSDLSVFYANNLNNYDFRKSAEIEWSTLLKPPQDSTIKVLAPVSGWKVFFIQYQWSTLGGNLFFTTNMFRLPTTYPCKNPPYEYFSEIYFWITIIAVCSVVIGIVICCILCFVMSFTYENMILKIQNLFNKRKNSEIIRLQDEEIEEQEEPKDIKNPKDTETKGKELESVSEKEEKENAEKKEEQEKNSEKKENSEEEEIKIQEKETLVAKKEEFMSEENESQDSDYHKV